MAEDIAYEAQEDAAALDAEHRAMAAEAFEALVREDYEPNPYDGTYSEM